MTMKTISSLILKFCHMLIAASQLNKPRKRFAIAIQVLCLQRRATGVPNPVYPMVFTVKVT